MVEEAACVPWELGDDAEQPPWDVQGPMLWTGHLHRSLCALAPSAGAGRPGGADTVGLFLWSPNTSLEARLLF